MTFNKLYEQKWRTIHIFGISSKYHVNKNFPWFYVIMYLYFPPVCQGVVSEVKNVGVLYWLDRKNGGQKKIRPHPKQSKTEQKIWMDGLITENR